jgi:hypothetical protein
VVNLGIDSRAGQTEEQNSGDRGLGRGRGVGIQVIESSEIIFANFKGE